MKKIIFLAAAFVTIAACTNELNEQKAVPAGKRVITAKLQIGTKTSFNEARTSLAWANGDKIGIFSNELEDRSSATYTGVNALELTVSESATAVYAYYPYTESSASPSAVNVNIALHQHQAVAGQFNGTNLPMVASGAIENDEVALSFEPLAAVLGFNVYGSTKDEVVKYISFSSNAEAIPSVAGTTSVDIASPALALTGDNATARVYLDTPVSVAGSKPSDARTAEGQVFLVVKKAVYPAGTDIIVKTDKEFYRFRTNTELDLNSNDYVVMNLNLSKGKASEMGYGDTQFILDAIEEKVMNVKGWNAGADIFERRIDGFFPGVNVGVFADNKVCITVIKRSTKDNVDYLTGFPKNVDLPELTRVDVSRNTSLAGKPLPEYWNTPKLKYFNISRTGICSVIPDSFAANTPNLEQIFADLCFLYGAFPHHWASKKMEVIIISHGWMHDSPEAYNYYLGYLIPRELDVVTFNVAQGDKTQMKLGYPANFTGYEAGWGQERYETNGGTVGDLMTWDRERKLNTWDNTRADFRAGYYYILPEGTGESLHVWSQTDADAYTARVKDAAIASAQHHISLGLVL